MGSPRKGIKCSELHTKLFGPTLDDSILYGVDCLLDYFIVGPAKKSEPYPESTGDETVYESCESLPPGTLATLPPQAVSKFTVPKLSPKEMAYIRGAILQTRRRHGNRLAESEPTERKTEPKVLRRRWAIVRVNEFDDGTSTYEIMKPTNEKLLPAQALPDGSEIVFAMFQNGCTGAYRVEDDRTRS